MRKDRLRGPIILASLLLGQLVNVAGGISGAQDPCCEKLRMANDELTEPERAHLRKFGMSPSPVNIDGDVFYVLHERLGESCDFRLRVGGLLHGISSGRPERENRVQLGNRESEVVAVVDSLWRAGAIGESDLGHQRELLLVFDGFDLDERLNLVKTALQAEGVSSAVIFALWTLPPPAVRGLSESLVQEFDGSSLSVGRLMLGLTIMRTGITRGSVFDLENLMRGVEISSDSRRILRSIHERIQKGEQVTVDELFSLDIFDDD